MIKCQNVDPGHYSQNSQIDNSKKVFLLTYIKSDGD